MVRRTGQMGVPVTQIDGEMVIGFDRPRLARIIGRLRATPARPPALGAAVKDAPDGGALVGSVRPDTPAARAGLQPDDVILEVDGRAITGADALANAINEARTHGKTLLCVRREDQTLSLLVRFVPI
jgi:S1-C subfamily serine protease